MKFITLLLVASPILALAKDSETTVGNMMSTRERILENKVPIAESLPTATNAGKHLAAVVASHGKRTNKRRFLKTGLPPAKGKGKGNDLISKGRSEGVNETNIDDDGCPFWNASKCLTSDDGDEDEEEEEVEEEEEEEEAEAGGKGNGGKGQGS